MTTGAPDILQRILARKNEEIAARKRALPLAELLQRAAGQHAANSACGGRLLQAIADDRVLEELTIETLRVMNVL